MERTAHRVTWLRKEKYNPTTGSEKQNVSKLQATLLVYKNITSCSVFLVL
jgi:hypothetical protein